MHDLSNAKREILDYLNEIADIIRNNIDAQGITASGKTKESLKVAEVDGHLLLYQDRDKGGAPIATTEVGRKGGSIPMDFGQIIYQWSLDKGIPFESDKSRKKFANAVAYGKIARFGYGRPSPSKFGKQTDNVFSQDVNKAVYHLKNIIQGAIIKDIQTILTR